ncbi:MAG: hypothetical protein FJX29_03205 [Alphaproteobacteria bacterium]|nr:hypothetical protein [Alphaproteobacteria bacterium]
MKTQLRTVLRTAIVTTPLFCAALAPQSAGAQELYAGKTVTILVGGNPGGGYDLYARAIARHLSRHIPGAPQVVVRNQPGAGSGTAAAAIYTTAPKDGTWIGALFPGVIIGPVLDPKSRMTFEPAKFHYIASADSGTRVCITGEKSKIRTMQDAIKQRAIMGASAAGGSTRDYAYMLRHTAGAQFQIISGYKGTVDILLALETGELDGLCGLDWTSLKSQRPQWIGTGKMNVILQTGLSAEPELAQSGTPPVWNFIKNEQDKAAVELILSQQIFGRPYVTAPETPPAAVSILRKAFMDTFRDKEFLADATKSRLDIGPSSGEDVQKLVAKLFAASPETVARARALIRE